jgi:hypothetical protein
MSTLLEIRTEFVKQSGRYDLVVNTDDYADNGADFLIQSGQRWLDQHQFHKKAHARYKKDVAAGVNSVSIKKLISPKEVWIANSEGRTKLTKVDLEWIREEYSKPVASSDQGAPLYYALTVNRMSPEQKALTSANYTTEFTYDAENIIFADQGDAAQFDTVIIQPPPDETYTLEVLGIFFSELTADTDTSFWTIHHPEVSVLAAMLAESFFFHNREGSADMISAIDSYLYGIDKGQVEFDIAEMDQIGG